MSAREAILIGVDIGTTNLKAVAIDATRNLLSLCRRPMVIATPAPGAAEFDLAALDRALHDVLAETAATLAAKGRDLARVAAISVDSIGESFVGLDADDRPVLPVPTWYDRRTGRLRATVGIGAKEWYDTTGMVDDDIYTIWRLLWWRRACPDEMRRITRLFSVADYALFLLGKAHVANPSLSARSGLADRNTLAWSQEHLAAAGIDEGLMPRLLPQGRVAAGLTVQAAQRTGLVQGTPLVHAGHDHACAGFGCGVVTPGTFVDSAGTAESLTTVVSAPITWEGVNRGEYDCYPHAVPGRYLLSGHIPSSGGAIDWMTARLIGPAPAPSAREVLWEAAAKAPPGSGGVRVAPYLQGTGSPWNRRDERLRIDGIDAQTSAGDMLRAVHEGLAAWLGINVERFEAISGVTAGKLLLTGGGSRNRSYSEIKAAMLRRPLLASDVPEAAGIGAALMGGIAVGLFADAQAALAGPAPDLQQIAPDPELATACDAIRASLVAHLTPQSAP